MGNNVNTPNNPEPTNTPVQAPGSVSSPQQPSRSATGGGKNPNPVPQSQAKEFFDRYVQPCIHGAVLILSLALIVWISYDTFKQIPFLDNHRYMEFQFWVCVIFLGAFFAELIVAPEKGKYWKRRWFFFLISIPYLNIIELGHLSFSADVLYYLRFIPLIRGAYSLAMVLGFISTNRAVSLLVQYATILAALVYLLAMVFYYQEYGLNENVTNFWDALYWSAMNMTTVGCYFSAVTPAGKVISVILPILGMLMLPLFTVYVTDFVTRRNKMQQSEADIL